LQKITVVMEKFDPKGEKLAPLFITVDPETDTTEVMKRYVEGYNPHIVGLTGTEKQITAVEEAYKVYAAKQPGTKTVDHSAYVYLMSPEGTLLQIFSVEESAGKIIKGLKESVK
jgi:protein SCO1/2